MFLALFWSTLWRGGRGGEGGEEGRGGRGGRREEGREGREEGGGEGDRKRRVVERDEIGVVHNIKDGCGTSDACRCSSCAVHYMYTYTIIVRPNIQVLHVHIHNDCTSIL